MLDWDRQTQFADATAHLMRACAVATAQTMADSACRGLTLWSDMLRSSVPKPAPTPWISAAFRAAPDPAAFWRVPSQPAGMAPFWGADLTMGYPRTAWASFGAWPMALHSPAPLSAWGDWSRMYWPGWSAPRLGTIEPMSALAMAGTVAQAVTQAAAYAPFSSYRSPGGHAAAQIITQAAPAVVAGMAATAAVSQIDGFFSVWKAVLGV